MLMGLGLTAVLIGAAILDLGSAMVARHQAQAAADLGALAGALHAVEGRYAACGRATEVVAANGGQLSSCSLDGLDITVRATVAPAGPASRFGRAVAVARAGPVIAAAVKEQPARWTT